MSGTPPLPDAIGRYKPLGVLGSGAMGTVYRAHDPSIDRLVAIKLIRTDALEHEMREEYIERFRREVQTAGRCNHAAIVRVFDFSGDAHNPYIVMEMVEGRPLHHVLRDIARVGTRRMDQVIVPILRQVLDGLGYAHRLGITHRDVKPGNILVSDSGDAKIVDFGIARLAEGSLTQAGSMLGTPSYMAPEQVSKAMWIIAPTFAAGAILYEAFAGKPPFVGRTLSDTILRLSLPDPAPMEPIIAAGAGAFAPVLQKALAKQREQRFMSAEEFSVALGDVLSIQAQRPASSDAPDSTVIMGVPPPPNLSVTLGPVTAGDRWDPALLARIERALATYAGPMARMMVREAARASTTADELVQALAQGLGTSSDRSQFLRAMTATGSHPTLGPGPGSIAAIQGWTPSAPGPGSLAQTAAISFSGIPAPAVEAAQGTLVVFVGPMARVLARKAAAEAKSAADFIERLCAHVAKPDDNAALRLKLAAEVLPKLR